MSDNKRKIIMKKLTAFNTIWHPETTLVFKSQKERLVIGRYVDGDIISLDDDAIELSAEWNFQVDKSLIAEVVADETLIAKSRESILRYFKKYKYSLFTSRFIGKFNDLSGVQLTQSTK